MLITNKVARLITFNWNKISYRLLPAGPAVEVPDDAMGSKFLKTLIKDGDVVESTPLTKEEKAAKEAEEQATAEAAELKALQGKAKNLGVEFDDTWTAEDLAADIEYAELYKKAIDLDIEVKDTWDSKKLEKEIKKTEK